MNSDERNWRSIAEVYPSEAKEQAENGSFYGPSDYDPLLRSWGYGVLLQVDDEDYQGDSRLLLKRWISGGMQYGYLKFGWGSCSGCDSLQACSTLEEIEALRRELHAQIRWGTRPELLEFFKTHDWQGDYDWHHGETRRFVRAAVVLLEEVPADV